MDFFILHKVLRMFRFTPLEMAKNFKNFIKAFFEVNHLKWSRTKQIHLCLGLNTCKWNFVCGWKFGKIRFLSVSPNFSKLFQVFWSYFEWTNDIYRATSDPGGELSEYWTVGFDFSKTGALSFTSWTFMTTSVSTCWPAPSVAISLVL